MSEKDRLYGGFHLRRPPDHRPGLPPARPAREVDAQRAHLPEPAPLHRGHPATVASILLADGLEGAETAVSLVAFAVCATLLLQATTAGYVAGVSV